MRSPVGGVELELAPDLAELGDAHLAEVADIEVVALARGLELLLLLEFGDGGAVAARLGTSTGSSVAGALIALVWAGSGHLVRGHLWCEGGRDGCRPRGRGAPGRMGAERGARRLSRSAGAVGILGA